MIDFATFSVLKAVPYEMVSSLSVGFRFCFLRLYGSLRLSFRRKSPLIKFLGADTAGYTYCTYGL